MGLKVGQKVKIIGKAGYERIGVISLITKYYIQVQFKSYRECYNKVDILPKGPIEMFVKKDKNWVKVIGTICEKIELVEVEVE